MLARAIDKALDHLPALGEAGMKLSRTLHRAVLRGGEPARSAADVLHGKWLGHPLHPVLTDVTIGAWAMGALFDAIAAVRGDSYAEQAADTLTLTGTLSAIPTLLTGLADFSTVQKPAVPAATLHAAMNNVNLALYVLSVVERRRGNRKRGVYLSSLALALSAVAAWLGGHLVYSQQVGVDHASAQGPSEWTGVLPADELREGEPRRVKVKGNPVLLYRLDGTLYAIDAVCSHAGGPLDEGAFDGCYVECPWHNSVFDLRDGGVRHGPATQPQPNYAARIRDGQIEVRLITP